MDYRKLYIELIVEFCNQDEAKAETVVDEALRRRELKKQGDEKWKYAIDARGLSYTR